jgi:hypothetical protein
LDAGSCAVMALFSSSSAEHLGPHGVMKWEREKDSNLKGCAHGRVGGRNLESLMIDPRAYHEQKDGNVRMD